MATKKANKLKEFLNHSSGKYGTVLHAAVITNNPKAIDYFLDLGGDINVKNQFGHSLLHDAAYHAKFESLKHLVKKGAVVDILNPGHETPLSHAVAVDFTWGCDHLIKNGAAVDHRRHHNGETLLHRAVVRGHNRVVSCLLKHKANVNLLNGLGNTALHEAVLRDQVNIVKLLLKPGDCNLEITNEMGQTAEEIAFTMGNSEMIDAFSEHVSIVVLID